MIINFEGLFGHSTKIRPHENYPPYSIYIYIYTHRTADCLRITTSLLSRPLPTWEKGLAYTECPCACVYPASGYIVVLLYNKKHVFFLLYYNDTNYSLCHYMRAPRRKGTRTRAVFTPNFMRITARYRPKPFTSGAIENKVKRGALRLCARSNLRLLSFNDPEYRSLQACLNVETLSSLIFEPLAPARWGVTGRWTVNISRISADIRVVPTNARANHVFVRSFSPGHGYASWMRPVATSVWCRWRESPHYKAQDWSEL